MTAYDSVHVMCSCEEEVEEEGRSLGHRLSAALRVECRSFAHAQHNTHVLPQCTSVITSPVRTPSPVITHTVRVCVRCANGSGSGTKRTKRTRETDRPNGPGVGWPV
uniref:(northern house mosquito) hypothetical protein n=1 Tax=Culex pipiens TaxID=7175 RepID=A0A8D8J645_CULPI